MGAQAYVTCRDFLEETLFSGDGKNMDVCLAYSGGADSGVLLRLLCDARDHSGSRAEIWAVTLDTRLLPRADVKEAGQAAKECRAKHVILPVCEEKNEAFMKNTAERCYFCKKYLFEHMLAFAEEKGILPHRVLEGTNADDRKQYRPGIRAVHELGILSPFSELSISKATIRGMGRELGLTIADKPSAPCLATRLPYGTPIDFGLLDMLERGEAYLKSSGFETVRIRLHGNVARIEIKKEEFANFLQNREKIVSRLKKEGFSYLTLDLEGFRSGSMDEYSKA